MRTVYILQRFSSGRESTLGVIHKQVPATSWKWLPAILRNDTHVDFKAFSLEDQHQDEKVMHETRIPSGVYKIKLRNAGGVNDKYTAKFNWHEGMLWLQDVPGFTWIYIHIGNTDDHSSGCVLVGDGCYQNITGRGSLSKSTDGYKRLYQEMLSDLSKGEVVLDVRDYG